MVFHSHMLNPRNFLEDCIRFDARGLWARGMPWAEVNQAIDTRFDYNVSEATKAAWVAYAVSQGLDRATAEDLTKAELLARYGE